MTPRPDFDRTITAWLDERTPPRAPDDLLAETLAQSARTRPRPAWLLPERWIPMRLRIQLAVLPRAVLIVVTLMLLAALTAAAIAVGSQSPAPTRRVTNGIIAFDSNGDIFTVEQDGSGLRQLTQTTDAEASPQWSPDGMRLLYWVSTSSGGAVRIANADGTINRALTAPDGITMPGNAWAVWSPDGRAIAANVWERGGTDASHVAAIAIFDSETGVGHKLDIGMPAWGASWSPAGNLVAFGGAALGGADEFNDVWVVAPDGSGLRRLSTVNGTPVTLGEAAAAFSPDGDWIYLQQQAKARADGDLLAVRTDGSGERAVIVGPTNDIGPAVSPDGGSVAFERPSRASATGAPTDPSDLYVVSADGSGPHLVSGAQKTWAGSPTWSPDGTRLVTSSPSFDQQIVFTLDGSAPPIAIPSPGNIGYLSWQRILQ